MEIGRSGDQPCILVEVPRSGIAEFYGNWLLAASKAEAFWKHAYGEPEFARKVDRLTVVYFPDFGLAGCGLLMRLNHRFASFIINFNEDELVDEFGMMAEMGFFFRSEESYKMAIPTDLSLMKVKAATLRYAQTEDEEYNLHPEHLVSLMPTAHALQWQMRQLAISDFCRESNAVSSRNTPLPS
jgi:hypothetical protein